MIAYCIIVALICAATWVLGWWGVAIVAVAAAWLLRERRGVAWMVALSAAVAWSILLVTDAVVGPLGAAANTLGAVMRIPAPALLAVTVLYPALIAWSAASATIIVSEYLRRPSAETPVA